MAQDKKGLGKTLKSSRRKAAPSSRSSEAKSRPARGRSGKSQQTRVTKLARELEDALQRQSATAEILKVIASSPSDTQPMFDAIAERSKRLVDALSTTVFRLVDGMMHLQAFTPTTPEADATLQAMFPAPLSTFSWGESIRSGEIYQRYRTRTRTPARPGAGARLAQLPLCSPAA
jgi:hypothetical protein